MALSAVGAPSTLPGKAFTSADYIQHGIPAPDHPWSLAEYERAAKGLEVIAKENPAQLPRWKNSDSSDLFARLVSKVSFDELHDEHQLVEDRIRIGLEYLIFVTGTMDLYANASRNTSELNSEKMELAVQLLRLEHALAILSRELEHNRLRNLSDEDRRHFQEQRLTKLAKVSISLQKTLEWLTTPSTTEPEAREDCIRRLAEFMPALVRELPEEARVRKRIQLLNMIDAEKDKDVRAALVELSNALQKDRTVKK